jgi:hypothetical protein
MSVLSYLTVTGSSARWRRRSAHAKMELRLLLLGILEIDPGCMTALAAFFIWPQDNRIN